MKKEAVSFETSEVKEYLSGAYRLREFIAIKEDQLLELRAATERITTQSYEWIGSRSANSGNAREDILCKIMDIEEEIIYDIGTMIDTLQNIKYSIDLVEDKNYRLLLEMRYLNFKTWEDISDQLSYSERHIYRIHEEALRQVNIKNKKTA